MVFKDSAGEDGFRLRECEIFLVKRFKIHPGIFRNFSKIFRVFLVFSGTFCTKFKVGCRSAWYEGCHSAVAQTFGMPREGKESVPIGMAGVSADRHGIWHPT